MSHVDLTCWLRATHNSMRVCSQFWPKKIHIKSKKMKFLMIFWQNRPPPLLSDFYPMMFKFWGVILDPLRAHSPKMDFELCIFMIHPVLGLCSFLGLAKTAWTKSASLKSLATKNVWVKEFLYLCSEKSHELGYFLKMRMTETAPHKSPGGKDPVQLAKWWD